MPCRSCGGSGSSASSQFQSKQKKFIPLQKRTSRRVFMTQAQIKAYNKHCFQKAKMKNLMFR